MFNVTSVRAALEAKSRSLQAELLQVMIWGPKWVPNWDGTWLHEQLEFLVLSEGV